MCYWGSIVQVKYSSQALFEHLRRQQPTELVRLCDVLAGLFEQYQHEDRITVPLLTFLELLLNSGCMSRVTSDPHSNFATKILLCGKAEIASTVNSKKLTACIGFFCQLIQVGFVRLFCIVLLFQFTELIRFFKFCLTGSLLDEWQSRWTESALQHYSIDSIKVVWKVKILNVSGGKIKLKSNPVTNWRLFIFT